MTPKKFFVGRAIGLLVVLVIGLLVGGFYWFNSYIYNQKQAQGPADYKKATYIIENQPVILGEQGTQYFGNELKTDLNGDGKEDVVFIITQNTGGSGTFYYAVAALNTPNGYVGSDGYFLGDRIAPQTTEVSPNPNQKYVVVVNYADRAPADPMTAKPSIGKSAYLKLDPSSMQWGVVVPDFEGESR
jgi:hypothetical protein